MAGGAGSWGPFSGLVPGRARSRVSRPRAPGCLGETGFPGGFQRRPGLAEGPFGGVSLTTARLVGGPPFGGQIIPAVFGGALKSVVLGANYWVKAPRRALSTGQEGFKERRFFSGAPPHPRKRIFGAGVESRLEPFAWAGSPDIPLPGVVEPPKRRLPFQRRRFSGPETGAWVGSQRRTKFKGPIFFWPPLHNGVPGLGIKTGKVGPPALVCTRGYKLGEFSLKGRLPTAAHKVRKGVTGNFRCATNGVINIPPNRGKGP